MRGKGNSGCRAGSEPACSTGAYPAAGRGAASLAEPSVFGQEAVGIGHRCREGEGALAAQTARGRGRAEAGSGFTEDGLVLDTGRGRRGRRD